MISFRPLARSDYPLLAGWLAEPLVARWWHQDAALEAIEREYGTAIDGTEPSEVRVACLDGRPLGLIQRYAVAAYPEYLEEFAPVWPVPAGALSIDYLVGEPHQRGRGLGAAMVALFVAESWERHPEAGDVVVPVHADNPASWRTLERVGFTRVAAGAFTPDNPIDSRDHVVYRLRRPAD